MQKIKSTITCSNKQQINYLITTKNLNGNYSFSQNSTADVQYFNFYRTISRRPFSQILGFDPQQNYYKKLGLQDTATDSEIKKAFYSLAKKYHPDSNNGDKQQQTLHEEKFKDISSAYEVLSDQSKKSQYDELRRQFNSGPSGKTRTSSYSDSGEYTYGYDAQGKKRTNYTNSQQYNNQSSYQQNWDFNQTYQNTEYWKDTRSAQQKQEAYNKYYESQRKYEEARANYQKSQDQQYERDDRQHSYSNKYNDTYKQNWKAFYSQRNEQRRQNQQQRNYQNEPFQNKSEEDFMKQLFLSFLGFSTVTFLLFGIGSSKAQANGNAYQSYQKGNIGNVPFASISTNDQPHIPSYHLHQNNKAISIVSAPQPQGQNFSDPAHYVAMNMRPILTPDGKYTGKSEIIIKVNEQDPSLVYKKQRGGVIELPPGRTRPKEGEPYVSPNKNKRKNNFRDKEIEDFAEKQKQELNQQKPVKIVKMGFQDYDKASTRFNMY